MTADLIGWIGTVFFAAGSITIAFKWRSAFIYMLGGNIAFAAVGVMTGLPSLIATSSFMAILDVFAWVKWGKK